MYNFKHAVRVDTDGHWSRQISALLDKPLPTHATFEGESSQGKWYRLQLPASVWALAVRSAEGTTVAVYYSPYSAETELKEALNGSQEKTEVAN